MRMRFGLRGKRSEANRVIYNIIGVTKSVAPIILRLLKPTRQKEMRYKSELHRACEALVKGDQYYGKPSDEWSVYCNSLRWRDVRVATAISDDYGIVRSVNVWPEATPSVTGKVLATLSRFNVDIHSVGGDFDAVTIGWSLGWLRYMENVTLNHALMRYSMDGKRYEFKSYRPHVTLKSGGYVPVKGVYITIDSLDLFHVIYVKSDGTEALALSRELSPGELAYIADIIKCDSEEAECDA